MGRDEHYFKFCIKSINNRKAQNFRTPKANRELWMDNMQKTLSTPQLRPQARPSPTSAPTLQPTEASLNDGVYEIGYHHMISVWDIVLAQTTEGVSVISYPKNGRQNGENQRWIIQKAESDFASTYCTIKNEHSKMYLTTNGDEQIRQYPRNGKDNQLFKFIQSRDGVRDKWAIQCKDTYKYLTYDSGTPLIPFTDGIRPKEWKGFYDNKDQYFRITHLRGIARPIVRTSPGFVQPAPQQPKQQYKIPPPKPTATTHQQVKRRGYPYPNDWDLSKIDDELMRKQTYFQPLDITKNPVAQRIVSRFYEQCKAKYPSIQIISVESIQNQERYDEYQAEKQMIESNVRSTNECNLWHDTQSYDGSVRYYAEYSGSEVKSAIERSNNAVYEISYCKVLCGDIVNVIDRKDLVPWPKKSDGQPFDCGIIAGDNFDGNFYAIKHRNRAYPLFRITFRFRQYPLWFDLHAEEDVPCLMSLNVPMEINRNPAIQPMISELYSSFGKSNIELVEVNGNQNSKEYDNYQDEKERLAHTATDVNEKHLWCIGVDYDDRHQFNIGKFSVNPGDAFSDQFQQDPGVYVMIYYTVLCGDSISDPTGEYSNKNWPSKDNGDPADSLVTKMGDVYVINKANRIYELFHITYKLKYPTWWDMDKIDKNCGQAHLIPINPESDTFEDVSEVFYNTSKVHHLFGQFYPNIKIIAIQGIQKKELFDLYQSHKQILKEKFRDDEHKMNERDLWHGTEKIKEIIKSGFQREYNQQKLWGAGSYFAVNSGYSVNYASKPDHNGHQKMLLCSVLCGESTLGNEDITLKTWPKKSDGDEYDSLANDDRDIFVIRKDNRVYPKFIVTFVQDEHAIDQWSCKQCTFINKKQDTVCSICGAPKTM